VTHGTLALLAACAVLGATSAQAQTPPAEDAESMSQATTTESDMDDTRARGAFRLGRQYYEQGQFAQAAVEFERAYGLSGRGQLLFNAYLAYREAGDDPNAARTLRGYLSEVPDAPDREHLQARLTSLEATVTADAEREAQQRAEAEAARLEAQDAQRRLEEERNRPRTTRPWWPWLVVGGGAAITGVGVALGVVATQDADALRADCNGTGQCNPVANLESRRSSIQTMAIAGDALWISGAVISATGVVLAFALPDDLIVYSEGTSATVTPSAGCSADGCMASISGTF